MALYISLRSRLTSPSSSTLLIRHLLPSSSSHSFTSIIPTHDADKQPPRPHRHRIPCVSVMDPFTSRRSVGQLLQMMEQLAENPFASGGGGGGGRRGWDVKEDEEALYLRMEMPGLGKEQVKVHVENNTMVIKGEMEEKEEEEEDKRRYSSRIDLPIKVYKVDDIKAEMKNGVLKVVVPKLKEEERAAHVFNVQFYYRRFVCVVIFFTDDLITWMTPVFGFSVWSAPHLMRNAPYN